MVRVLTIANHKEVNSENRETLSDVVVCILELSLHHRGVDFDQDNTSQSGDQHPVDG